MLYVSHAPLMLLLSPAEKQARGSLNNLPELRSREGRARVKSRRYKVFHHPILSPSTPQILHL